MVKKTGRRAFILRMAVLGLPNGCQIEITDLRGRSNKWLESNTLLLKRTSWEVLLAAIVATSPMSRGWSLFHLAITLQAHRYLPTTANTSLESTFSGHDAITFGTT